MVSIIMNGATIYKCKLPPEHSLINLAPEFEALKGKDPVVVFLKSDKVKLLIDSYHPEGFRPNQKRLKNVEEMLNSYTFELPIISFNGRVIRLVEGRHRVAAMWFRFEEVIPFITDRAMAPKIHSELGTIGQSLRFDLSDARYPIFSYD